MKIGIYGGTFDPVHLGHLLLAEIALEECQLNQVWFVPAFQSPLKESIPAALPRQRLEMLRLAIAGYPCYAAKDLEIKRKGTSYTVDTLTTLAEQNPEAELFLLMGADSLDDFPRWKEPLEILKLAQVVAVNRGRTPASLESVRAQLGEAVLSRFRLLTMPAVDLSATDLRARCAAGKSIRFQTPRAIEQYARHHKLYTENASADFR